MCKHVITSKSAAIISVVCEQQLAVNAWFCALRSAVQMMVTLLNSESVGEIHSSKIKVIHSIPKLFCFNASIWKIKVKKSSVFRISKWPKSTILLHYSFGCVWYGVVYTQSRHSRPKATTSSVLIICEGYPAAAITSLGFTCMNNTHMGSYNPPLFLDN